MNKTAWNHPAPEARANGPIGGHLARTYVQHGYYVIISAERAELGDEENVERTKRLAAEINTLSLSYLPTCGSYAGKREHGFLVMLYERTPGWPRTDDAGKTKLISDVDALVELAEQFEQDSILVALDGAAHIIESGTGMHLDCFATCEAVRKNTADQTTALFPGATESFRWENL